MSITIVQGYQFDDLAKFSFCRFIVSRPSNPRNGRVESEQVANADRKSCAGTTSTALAGRPAARLPCTIPAIDAASVLNRTRAIGETSALPNQNSAAVLSHIDQGRACPMEPSHLRRGKGAFLLPLTHDQPYADWMPGRAWRFASPPAPNHAEDPRAITLTASAALWRSHTSRWPHQSGCPPPCARNNDPRVGRYEGAAAR